MVIITGKDIFHMVYKAIMVVLVLAIVGEGMAQSKKLSRTKQRAHGVDSVKSWGIDPDSTRSYDKSDSLDMPRTNKP